MQKQLFEYSTSSLAYDLRQATWKHNYCLEAVFSDEIAHSVWHANGPLAYIYTVVYSSAKAVIENKSFILWFKIIEIYLSCVCRHF